jgi:uncharacterized PurR-regulated membrane protein YhhQ (DUF165 family)
MSVFVLTDMFASFNSRKFVMMIIGLEALANLFFISFTNWINRMPYPDYFHHAAAYNAVFNPIIALYVANLIGTFIAAALDLFIFYYLYKKRNWSFFIASFCSSILTISCYTVVTDYFAFKDSYPTHFGLLTHINLVTNFITLALYAILGQIAVSLLQRYLHKKA